MAGSRTARARHMGCRQPGPAHPRRPRPPVLRGPPLGGDGPGRQRVQHGDQAGTSLAGKGRAQRQFHQPVQARDDPPPIPEAPSSPKDTDERRGRDGQDGARGDGLLGVPEVPGPVRACHDACGTKETDRHGKPRCCPRPRDACSTRAHQEVPPPTQACLDRVGRAGPGLLSDAQEDPSLHGLLSPHQASQPGLVSYPRHGTATAGHRGRHPSVPPHSPWGQLPPR